MSQASPREVAVPPGPSGSAAVPPAPRRFGPGTVSRDAALSFVYNAVVRVSTAALSIVVARTVGPEGNGALGVALQVAAFGVLLTTINVPQGLAQHLAATTDDARRARWLRAATRLVLPLAAAGAVLLALLAGPLATRVFGDARLVPVLRACAPLVLAMAGYLLTEAGLQGLRRFGTLARWGGAVTLLDLLFVIPATRFGVAGVLLARAAIRLGALGAGWVLWLRRVADGGGRPVAESPGTGTGSLLRFAGPTFLAGVTTIAAQLALRTLLVRSAGLAETGQMQAADSLAQGLLLIPIATTAALMPAVSRTREAGGDAFAGIFTRGLRQVTALHLAACLAAIAIVPVLVPLVFGRDFTAARPVFVLLALAYGLAGPSTVFSATLLGRGEVWSGLVLNLLWGAVALGTFGLSGSYGARGAAFAMGVGYLAMLLVCAAVFPARWKVRPGPVLAPVLAPPLVLAGVGWLAFQPAMTPAVVPLVALGLAAGSLAWGWASGARGGSRA